MNEQGRKLSGMLLAAQTVLAERGAPLGYREILAESRSRNLIMPSGQTPERTLYARLHEEIRRNPGSPFLLCGPGVFGLKRYPTRDLSATRAKLVDWLVEMPARDWESVISELLLKMGFARIRPGTLIREGIAHYVGDARLGGVIPVEVAALALLNRVELSRVTVRALRGSLSPGQSAVIFSVGMPDPGAREEALRPGTAPVTFVAGDDLLELLREHGLGPDREAGIRLAV